jgi:hypothetical protein
MPKPIGTSQPYADIPSASSPVSCCLLQLPSASQKDFLTTAHARVKLKRLYPAI